MQNNDDVLTLLAQGYDGSNYRDVAAARTKRNRGTGSARGIHYT